MEMTLKALYNSLRISALQNPHLSAEPWQIEDYRTLSLAEMFERLGEKEIFLDRSSFLAYANEYDSPEELLEAVISEEQAETEESDQIYLLFFELWRRLVPEKQSLSLICDELDYQIFLFDSETLDRRDSLEDALASFYSILVENLDNGLSQKDVFITVAEYCANDVSSFLYDYISELVELKEYVYATELLEQFYPFVPDRFWFDFLHARLAGVHNIRQANLRIRKLVQEMQKEPQLALNFDILSYLSQGVDIELFREIVIQSLPQIESEDDLCDLFRLSADFFESAGNRSSQKQLEELLERREGRDQNEVVAPSDSDIKTLKGLLATQS